MEQYKIVSDILKEIKIIPSRETLRRMGQGAAQGLGFAASATAAGILGKAGESIYNQSTSVAKKKINQKKKKREVFEEVPAKK